MVCLLIWPVTSFKGLKEGVDMLLEGGTTHIFAISSSAAAAYHKRSPLLLHRSLRQAIMNFNFSSIKAAVAEEGGQTGGPLKLK